MEEKLNNCSVKELSAEESTEINAGSERADKKRTNLWESVFEYFRI